MSRSARRQTTGRGTTQRKRFSKSEPASLTDHARDSDQAFEASSGTKWRLLAMLIALSTVTLGAIVWGLPVYWTKQAERALASGNYRDADAYFQQVQRFQPRNADAALGQARAARRSRDPARARSLLSIAESRGVGKSRIALEQELIHIQGGGSMALANQLPAMLVKSPEYGAEILEAFAFGFETLGKPELALPYIDDWLVAAPEDPIALQHKAELLATLGDKAAAERMFEDALRKNNGLVRARKGLARLKMEMGKNLEALAFFDTIIESDASDVDSRLLRSNALFALRRDQEAIDGLKQVLVLDEFNFAARHSLASEFAEQGEHQQVVALIEPLLSEFPEDVSLNYLLASAFTELGNSAKAEACLKKHLEGRKELNELAKLKYELQSRQEDGEAILKLAEGYLRYQWDEAGAWLAKAITALPESPKPYQAMASFQRKKGDFRRANEYSRAASRLAADSTSTEP